MAGTYESIRRERIGSVLKLTIDNPRSALNVVDSLVHHELTELFAELRRERDARAVLLTGSKRAFSAGGDFAFDTSTALELVTFMSRDHVEALDALKEKRAPRFEGR